MKAKTIMNRRLFLIFIVLILMFTGGSTHVSPSPETDAKAIVPKYVVNAKELLGTSLEESEAKVRATTDFRPYMVINISYENPNREYGRTAPYFTEALFNPIETHTLNHKAYLSLSQNLYRGEVERVELTHSGVVSAEVALKMLGYDPYELIEHPVKHRNADRSDWFAVIDPYFHIIEIQWFDAEKPAEQGVNLGRVTQIRVSVW